MQLCTTAAVYSLFQPHSALYFSQIRGFPLVLSRREQPRFCALASKLVLFVLRQRNSQPQEVFGMLWTIFVILLVLWLVGLVSSYTLGGFIHLLLVAAVVVLILQLISGRRAAL